MLGVPQGSSGFACPVSGRSWGLGIRRLDQDIYGMYSRGAFCGHGRYAEPGVLASLGCCPATL